MKKRAVRYGVVGVGQGGGRLAAEFAKLGYPTVAVNTSPQDLEPLDVKEKVALGTDGAGKDPTVGAEALERGKDKVLNALQRVFGTDVDHVLICAGSSGGTGGGAVVPIIDVVKKLNLPVGVLTTLPLKSEDTRCKQNTLKALKNLTARAIAGDISPFILMDNEKIIQNYPNLSTLEFWDKANEEVVQVFDLFNALSAQNSAFTSLDPADYKKLLTAGGLMIFGSFPLKGFGGETSLSQLVSENLDKGLLASGFDYLTATRAGIIIVGPENLLKKLTRVEEEATMATLKRFIGSGTVYRGVYVDSRLTQVQVLTVLSGLNLPVQRVRELVDESKKETAHLEKKVQLQSLDDVLNEGGSNA